MRACSKAPCSTLSLAARTGIPPETAGVTYGQSSKVPDRSVAALSIAGPVKGATSKVPIAHERTCAPLIFVRKTSGFLDGCTVAACTKQQLDGTRKCRATWHCWFLTGRPEQGRVTRLALASCSVDLPATSIPTGLRKHPSDDAAGTARSR